MGFHTYSSPYDWSRLDRYRSSASAVPGGLVDLSVGSPVDPVPVSVQRALAESSDAGDSRGYPRTAGSPELRQSIKAWFQRERGVDLDGCGADILPTVGSKEAVALMASFLHLGPGDRVIQPSISYPTYAIGTQLAGAEVLRIQNLADVDSWVGLPGLKAVWVNSPSNPTGQVMGADDLRSIVRAARSIGAVVLSDECYALLDWSGPALSVTSSPCILDPRVCQGSARGLVCLYSLSKQSNMAGYRSAFMAGDSELIGPMTAYRKQIGQIISGPVQHAMIAGLADRQAVKEQALRYRKRLQNLVVALSAFGYEASMPDGGLYIWVATMGRDCWQDMEHLAGLGILPSPGDFYGDPTHLRFSVTASDADLNLAFDRLKRGSR